MRLLHVHTLQFAEYVSPYDAPPYIIASHRWLEGEVSYQAFLGDNPGLETSGMAKIAGFCHHIRDWGQRFPHTESEIPEYLWIDTCCINKESSAELQEAITSMFQWYAMAWCCLAWINDLEGDLPPLEMLKGLGESVWFTRGKSIVERV